MIPRRRFSHSSFVIYVASAVVGLFAFSATLSVAPPRSFSLMASHYLGRRPLAIQRVLNSFRRGRSSYIGCLMVRPAALSCGRASLPSTLEEVSGSKTSRPTDIGQSDAAGSVSALEAHSEDTPEAVRLLVFDSMVPGQRLQMDLVSPTFVTLLREQAAASGTLVMVGSHRLKLNTHGVEVKLKVLDERSDGYACVVLQADRCCEVVDVGEDEGSKWLGRAASVRWLNFNTRAPAASHVANSCELEALVQEWLQAVRSSGCERFRGHLEEVVRDLGTMPEASKPDERALWVAGLINPLPALGVAMEVRPAVLMAGCGCNSTERRLKAVEMGIRDSLMQLKSSL